MAGEGAFTKKRPTRLNAAAPDLATNAYWDRRWARPKSGGYGDPCCDRRALWRTTLSARCRKWSPRDGRPHLEVRHVVVRPACLRPGVGWHLRLGQRSAHSGTPGGFASGRSDRRIRSSQADRGSTPDRRFGALSLQGRRVLCTRQLMDARTSPSPNCRSCRCRGGRRSPLRAGSLVGALAPTGV
jgi:hypothetical protein